jgi:hypothetical protein
MECRRRSRHLLALVRALPPAPGAGCRRRGGSTLLAVLILALQAPPPEYQTAQVGRVTVLAPRTNLTLGVALAEQADRPATWPGLGRKDPGPLRLILLPDESAFRRVSQGRIPGWGIGMAMPGARTIVIRADADDPMSTLRHELAHLALHEAVHTRVPLWFDEGYAVVAAGEWSRLDALQLNLAVVRGVVSDFRALDAALRQNAGEAEAGYALAASAVLHLGRLNPARTLDALLGHLQAGEGFDSAVVATTGLSVDRFEEAWQKDVRKRYNLVVWFVAGGGWALLGGIVVLIAALRRRRDRPRREALNQGWEIPEEATENSENALDPETSGD